MSNYDLNHFVDGELYPRVFEQAPKIFPEFQFNKKGAHWVSGNGLKVDGSEGEKHKVYIYQDRPYLLQDYTRGGKEITKYLIESGRHNSWIEVVKYLAKEVGISIPESNLSNEHIESIAKKTRQAELLEVINSFFVNSLLSEKGKDADAVRNYLHKDRGYSGLLPESQDEIHSNKMELGFIPSREALKEYLKANGFNKEAEEIDSLFTQTIGKTHKLVIPCRALGRIVCFAFRNINHKQESEMPKYLYSTGERGAALFSFKAPVNNNKDIVIVESPIDAIHAKAQGIDSVIALGGRSLNSKQAESIKRYGFQSVTLCLDNEKQGKEATPRIIDELLKIDLRVYVATLPQGIKDPDELMRSRGAEAFKEAITTAKAWYLYQQEILFSGIADNHLNDKARDQLINESTVLGLNIKNPVDREKYVNQLVKEMAGLGISPDALHSLMEQLQYKAAKEKKTAELKKGLAQANALVNSGQETKAVELLSDIGKQINIESSVDAYERLFKPITREDIVSTLQKEADSFDTGFLISKSPLLIPSGAPSFIAGRTGRGKTAFLINLAVNAVKAIPNRKPVVLFTYEENSRKILMKALNAYIGGKFSPNNRTCIYDHYNKKDARFLSKEARDEFIRHEKNFFEWVIEPGQLIIVDSQDYSDELINKIYYLHQHKQIGAVLIDYIQRINLRNSKKSTRQEDLKQICNDLADCSIKTGLPFIIGSQFNRQANDDRSTLTLNNLSEAGDIERIANMVIAVDIKHNDNPAQSSEFYVKILKNRDGVAEVFDSLSYDGNTGKISQSSSNVGKF